jgi:integrase
MGLDMAELRKRYKYTRCDTDRHGNVRWYTISPTGKKIRMHAEPGSDAWVREWENARNAVRMPTEGTLAGLIVQYLRSPEFASLKASTQSVRRRILDNVRDSGGDLPARDVTSADIRAGRDLRRDTPAAANNRMKAISAVYEWGKEAGLVETNPVRGVKRLKETGPGHHTWTVEECLAFEKRHPVGTMARLVYALALYTASRVSDLHRLGPQHMTGDGFIRIQQEKTDAVVVLPVVPPLMEAIKAVPPSALTFAVTSYGKPFSVKGISNKMREWCDQAGLPQCSAHGLRKATAARLAEHGMSAHQIAAVTGHRTLSEVQRYTAEADQKRLAKAALEGTFGEQSVPLIVPTDSQKRPPGKKAK